MVIQTLVLRPNRTLSMNSTLSDIQSLLAVWRNYWWLPLHWTLRWTLYWSLQWSLQWSLESAIKYAVLDCVTHRLQTHIVVWWTWYNLASPFHTHIHIFISPLWSRHHILSPCTITTSRYRRDQTFPISSCRFKRFEPLSQSQSSQFALAKWNGSKWSSQTNATN